MYQVQKNPPRKKKIIVNSPPPVRKYSVTGSVYRKKEDKLIPIEAENCREQNWDNHTSPDNLPSINSLPEAYQKTLAIIRARAQQRMNLEFKICDKVIADEMKVSERYVRRIIKALTELGFIGRCWRWVRDSDGKFHTWRMIRAHWLGWIERWVFTENAKSIRYDYRPDSNRLKAAKNEYVEPFAVRVLRSGKIHPKWIFTQEQIGVKPVWTTESEKIEIMSKGVYDIKLEDDFIVLREAYELGEPWAVQLLGVRPNLEDGILY